MMAGWKEVCEDMTKINLRRMPFGLWMIALFYLFGAVVLLVGMFTNPAGVSRSIADAHGLPSAVDPWILPVVAALAILIAYGLVTVSHWGFFLTIIYLTTFGIISTAQLISHFQQPYIGNLTWSLLVLVYLVVKRRLFQESAGLSG